MHHPTNSDSARNQVVSIKRHHHENGDASVARDPYLTALIVVVFLWLAATAAILGWSERAHAQWTPSAGDPVLLARVCAHEAGPSSAVDCAAIHEAIRGIARHRALTWDESAWLYSPRALGGLTARPWVAELGPVCRVPTGWVPAEDGSWTRYERRVAPLFELARVITRTSIDPCADEHVHDWAAPTDAMRARAARLGLIPVLRAGARNLLFARPSMRRRDQRLCRWLVRHGGRGA